MNHQFYRTLLFLLLLLTACQQSEPVETAIATAVPSSPVPTEPPTAAPPTAVPSSPVPTEEAEEASETPTASSSPVPTEGADAPTEGAQEGSETPAYQNAALPISERVEDLLGRMSLEEKLGQMTLVEKNSIKDSDITKLFIGALLSGGGGSPRQNTPEGWAEMVRGFQEQALATPLGIPLLYGVDAVHGHSNVKGTVIFPHNVGLGATRNAELVEQIGRITALETAATGIFWNYAPAVSVPQDIRWGRTFEGYSEDTELVTELSVAYLRGLQGEELSDPTTIIGTPKHFVGDGGTVWGTARTNDYIIDQGVTEVDEATLRAIHLPPYISAIEAGARSIMISYSSWREKKMHAEQYLISDVLKGELGFEGFVVSDWEAINQIDSNYYEAVVTAMNAGIDMNMVPYNYELFIMALSTAVEKEDVPLERIDDAVRRILTVKFELGLFENPYPDEALLAQVGSDEHREVARQAVRESLVLLTNATALPIAKQTPLIFVAGEAANDIGIQSGGWTIEWQGKAGKITQGTTILEGIEQTVSPDSRVQFNRFGKYDRITDEDGNPARADVGIVVVGEQPYAEGRGDKADLTLSDAQTNLITRVREQSRVLVIVLISGRPMVITDQLAQANAFVVAWLPGTEGQGVADMLFGDYPFTGKLPYTWPRSMDQIPFDFETLPKEGCDAPLFRFGNGYLGESHGPIEVLDCP